MNTHNGSPQAVNPCAVFQALKHEDSKIGCSQKQHCSDRVAEKKLT